MSLKNILFIPGNVPASKNSKTWTGKFLVSSKATQSYNKNSAPMYLSHKDYFMAKYDKLSKPVILLFHIVRKSKHSWDFDNCCNTILDQLVKLKILEDDCADFVMSAPLPIDGKLWSYDKENPGVYIDFLDANEYINILNKRPKIKDPSTKS